MAKVWFVMEPQLLILEILGLGSAITEDEKFKVAL